MATPDGRTREVKQGPTPVTITGTPGELALFAYGRKARVELSGDEAAVAAVREARFGL